MSTRAGAPPIGIRLRYRLFGSRVPDEWQPWVSDDLQRSGWLRRGHAWVALTPVAVVALVRIGFDLVGDRPLTVWTFSVLWTVAPIALLFVLLSPKLEGAAFYRRLRDRILAYQSGTGPHPTFGTESPRSMLGVAVVAFAIAGLIVLAVRLLT